MKKAKSKLDLPDARMLELIEWLKEHKIIRFRQEFCDVIEMAKQNVRQIREGGGRSHFTVAQIRTACEVFEDYVDVAWVMGFQDEMKRKLKSNGIKELKTAY